jgi:hypothetical protein
VKIDDDEVEVYCVRCNGYLYSIGPAEAEERERYGQDPQFVDCPMKKGPRGECTGESRTY